MNITTTADITSTQLGSLNIGSRSSTPLQTQPRSALPVDARSRYTEQMSNRRLRRARGACATEIGEVQSSRSAEPVSIAPTRPDVFFLESDPWASAYMLAALCDQDYINGTTKTSTSGKAAGFIDEWNRWAYQRMHSAEHPHFPRDRRHHPELTGRAAETYRKLIAALQAGAILDRALKANGSLQMAGLKAQTINESVAELAPSGGSLADARKVLWERQIPVCHLAAGIGAAWKLYHVDLTWRETFWRDLFVMQGSWVDLALTIAAHRREQAVASNLIRDAERRLPILGRAAADTDVRFLSVRRPEGAG